jgi:hypothetical protein
MHEINLADSRNDNRFNKKGRYLKMGLQASEHSPLTRHSFLRILFLSSLIITSEHYNLIEHRELMGLCYAKVDETATHNRSYYWQTKCSYKLWWRVPTLQTLWKWTASLQGCKFNWLITVRRISVINKREAFSYIICTSGVPRGVLSVSTPSRNSEVLTKPSRIPCSVENTSVTT